MSSGSLVRTRSAGAAMSATCAHHVSGAGHGEQLPDPLAVVVAECLDADVGQRPGQIGLPVPVAPDLADDRGADTQWCSLLLQHPQSGAGHPVTAVHRHQGDGVRTAFMPVCDLPAAPQQVVKGHYSVILARVRLGNRSFAAPDTGAPEPRSVSSALITVYSPHTSRRITMSRKFRVLPMTVAAVSASLAILAAAPLVYGATLGAKHAAVVKLAKAYSGTETNENYSVTADISLVKLHEFKVKGHPSLVKGTLIVKAPLAVENSPFVGILNGSQLTFTITHWKSAACETGGCTSTYTGSIGKHGAMTGYYSYYNAAGGTDGLEVGIWSVKPKS
jgi:hypothetical protein